MRPWREILKDDDARAAIMAVAITMAIALLIVVLLGAGCYGVYKLGAVIFSSEDPQRVTADHAATWYEINYGDTLKISNVKTYKFKTDTIRHDSTISSLGNVSRLIMPGATLKIQPLPRFRFNNETRSYVTDDTVHKRYYGPGGFKMDIEEIFKTDSITLRFIWSPDSVGGAEWMQLSGFINADSTPLVFSLKPKKIRIAIGDTTKAKP